MTEKTVTLDVRTDIENGREPFSKIMHAVDTLKEGEALELIAPFEPAPLFGLLGKRGFSHEAKPMENGDWMVVFRRQAAGPGREPVAIHAHSAGHCGCAGPKFLDLDVRGLESPQPMISILEKLAVLPEGFALRARTDRKPMHLYSQLEDRGFTGQSDEQDDGSYVTLIRRRR